MSILRGPGTTWLSKALAAVSENGHHLPNEAKPHSTWAALSYRRCGDRIQIPQSPQNVQFNTLVYWHSTCNPPPETPHPWEPRFLYPLPAPASSSSACLDRFANYGLFIDIKSDKPGGLQAWCTSLDQGILKTHPCRSKYQCFVS